VPPEGLGLGLLCRPGAPGVAGERLAAPGFCPGPLSLSGRPDRPARSDRSDHTWVRSAAVNQVGGFG
jgi:hypothetical protein